MRVELQKAENAMPNTTELSPKSHPALSEGKENGENRSTTLSVVLIRHASITRIFHTNNALRDS
jgi:hypothetical protein